MICGFGASKKMEYCVSPPSIVRSLVHHWCGRFKDRRSISTLLWYKRINLQLTKASPPAGAEHMCMLLITGAQQTTCSHQDMCNI